MTDRGGAASDEALERLREQLDVTIAELEAARRRVVDIQDLRAAGHPWGDIVGAEDRPLVVESVSKALEDLGSVGGRFRREEAVALHEEGVSITAIGRLFGVSRQRVSAYLQQHLRNC